VLAAVEKFYTEAVQHIKPWAPTPPKIRESEPLLPDPPTPADVPGGLQDDRAGDVSQITSNIVPTGGFAPGPTGRTPFAGGQTSTSTASPYGLSGPSATSAGSK
jgi:hypothetical protein